MAEIRYNANDTFVINMVRRRLQNIITVNGINNSLLNETLSELANNLKASMATTPREIILVN